MARDKNKRSLIPVSHYLFDFWKEALRDECCTSYGKGGRKPVPYTNVILFLDLTLSFPERDLSTKLITHSTLGFAENTWIVAEYESRTEAFALTWIPAAEGIDFAF